MAERRMFAKSIVESGRFLRMPVSAQALYFHLGINADDDGFVEAYPVMTLIKSAEDDLRVLAAKGYIKILNQDLVVLVMDWKENNYIRPDRYHPSIYKDLKLQIATDCMQDDNQMTTNGIPDDNQMTTNGRPRLGKDSLGKVRLGQDSKNIVGQETPDVTEKNKNSEAIAEIIDYLNMRTGRRFKATNRSTARLINARLNDGYTVEDFKEVIDKKCVEWMEDPHMQGYLRPETLFTPAHFESYLNQSVSQKKGQGLAF